MNKNIKKLTNNQYGSTSMSNEIPTSGSIFAL